MFQYLFVHLFRLAINLAASPQVKLKQILFRRNVVCIFTCDAAPMIFSYLASFRAKFIRTCSLPTLLLVGNTFAECQLDLFALLSECWSLCTVYI